MDTNKTPLFVRTHDFNVWLFRHTQRFPKSFRHTLTERLERLALDFEQTIVMANGVHGKQRREYLLRADAELQSLKVVLRYTLDFGLLSSRQIQFVSESTAELGRLLGAWLKGTAG